MDLVDLDAARTFMAGHARVLDRHRLLTVLGEVDGANALAAVDAYRNPDGGYGWGLEPDLRSVTSQPVGAMHAMEVFAEGAPITTVRAVELCDWLHGQTLTDGGLPFALPVDDPEGSSPIWTKVDRRLRDVVAGGRARMARLRHGRGRSDPARPQTVTLGRRSTMPNR